MIEIRKAMEADATPLEELSRTTFIETFAEHNRQEDMDAYAEQVKAPRQIELLRLYVSSKWLGRGVGPSLMNRSLAVARAEGFQTLWLGVWERNFRAQAFYRKFGFATVGQHGFKLGQDEQTDLIMVCEL